MFTGSNKIQQPAVFQVAATQADALAFPPRFIDITVPMFLFTDQAGLGPFSVVYASYAPREFTTISGIGAVTNPTDACSPLVTPITGKIGVVRDGDAVQMKRIQELIQLTLKMLAALQRLLDKVTQTHSIH